MTPSDLPNPSTAPREFLTQLYRAAVQRALPLLHRRDPGERGGHFRAQRHIPAALILETE